MSSPSNTGLEALYEYLYLHRHKSAANTTTKHPCTPNSSQTFTSCKHARGGFGYLKNFKIVVAGVSGVASALKEHTPFIRLR